MIENTNTKQFYPGPILNNTLEITDFLFNNAEQIKITHSKLNKEGILVDVDLNYPTDYEVTKVLPSDINAAEAALTASTGQIMLKNVKVLAGEKLTVYRISQIIQDKDYPRTGAFPAATHEGALDYLTMQNQEQQEELNRTLKVPISTGKFNAMVPVPLPNRILRIDEKATGFEFVPYDLDERLDTFEKDTNTTIAQHKQELLRLQDTFEANFEAETNTKIQKFEAETNTKIQGFEEEVNEKIQTVSDAADRINTLDEDLAIATQAATEASKAASTATNKANEILSVENQFLNKSQITNCVLEVPQRINYTLSNGTLTIKAGSKVIVPNKANKFDEITLSKDIPCNIANSDKNMLFIRGGNAYIARRLSSQTGSGTTNPTTGYHGFYNTTDNIVYDIRDGVTQNLGLLSLPVLIFTSDDTGVVSVDEVFNGFGCIGNTIFCNKGVKALIPNGRNANGTLKNTEITTSKVLVDTRNIKSSTFNLVLNASSFSNWTVANYDFERNYTTNSSGGNISRAIVGTCETDSTGRIINFKPYLPFRAVDYNEFNTKVDEIEATLDTKVNKSGDTMTGTLKSTANNGSEIHIQGTGNNNWLTIKGTVDNYDYNDYTNVPTELRRHLRLISYDKNGTYYFFQQVSAEPGRNVCAFQVKRKLTDGTEKTCDFALRVQDTGVNTPLINGQPLKAFVTETYVSGTSWYRVWSDGWIEQGGRITSTSSTSITFPKKFSNTNYTIALSQAGAASSSVARVAITTYQAESFTVEQLASKMLPASWYVCGY